MAMLRLRFEQPQRVSNDVMERVGLFFLFEQPQRVDCPSIALTAAEGTPTATSDVATTAVSNKEHIMIFFIRSPFYENKKTFRFLQNHPSAMEMKNQDGHQTWEDGLPISLLLISVYPNLLWF